MSVRARWYQDLEVPNMGDPFADVPVPAPGAPRLRPVGVLNGLVHQQLQAEGRLAAAGVTCPIKGRNDTTCSACPLHSVHPAMKPLCILGCEQERVLTELALVQADGLAGV